MAAARPAPSSMPIPLLHITLQPHLLRQAAAREELLCECEPRNTIHTDEQSPYTSERSVLSAALAGYILTFLLTLYSKREA